MSKVERAKAAIDEVHADTSVPIETTIERLRDIVDHARTLIEACTIDAGAGEEDEDL